MIQSVPAPEPATDVELPITFPKREERYKITSPQLRTDLVLAPRMRVRLLDAVGYVTKVTLDASGEDNTARWTVVLDRASLQSAE
jgi:hypothetical protein